MTTVYLAYSISGESRKTLTEMKDDEEGVNLLVSYVYLNSYEKVKHDIIKHPKTILDSGAYSAWKSGTVIDIEALIEESKNPRWKESVTLDVIGDAEKSVENSLYMKSKGSPAYPVFHYGDPWDHLLEYKKQFPKVGLSCRFGEAEKDSVKWLEKCFSLAWPYRFHSFGWVQADVLLAFPFHTADTASWNNAPAAYGRWKAFGGKMSVHGLKSLAQEVYYYRELQKKLEWRWRKEMEIINGAESVRKQQSKVRAA
jgi:hypothetical protein